MLMAGQAVEVTAPRVCRVIQILVHREAQIREYKQGHVEFHYGAPLSDDFARNECVLIK
jgi:hypothetical protein